MKVGVPVVPGTPGPVDAYTDGESFIQEYGFPGKLFGLNILLIILMKSDGSHYQGRDGGWRPWYASGP